MKTREGKLAHDAPEPKKPYSAPCLVKYGDLRQLTRGGRGRRADNHPGGPTRICWIAEVLYGADDPRTHILRIWLMDVYSKTALGSIVVAAYGRLGRQLSTVAKRSSLIRGILRPLFEAGLVRAHKHFISLAC